MGKRVKAPPERPLTKGANAVSRKKGPDFTKSINSPADRILFLQRNLGNRAVQRLFETGAFQGKLKIGRPGDVYEREADQVADEVMSMGEPGVRTFDGEVGTIQTKKESGHSAGNAYGSAPHGIIPGGGGRPLSKSTRAFFEDRMGSDLSDVRVHTDAGASESARALNATAFTHGSDIFFGEGRYQPETTDGRRLLAHELTHVAQQEAAEPPSKTFLQLQEVAETRRPPTSGVVQAWMYNQVDNWHTGATQALSFFREAVQEESSVGFWLQLAGNVLWASGAAFPPAGAVASGLIGVAIATIGGRVQARQDQEEYQRVQDIYTDLLAGMNDARSQMDAMVVAEADRVMALGTFQAAAQRNTASWQRVVRVEAGVPDADDVNAVSRKVERNLYLRYLRERGAWVYHDIFHVPSPHHPGTVAEHRHFYPHRIHERVRRRLDRIGVDWRFMHELPIPHRHRDLWRREGTVGAVEVWNYEEDTDFPPEWTEAERREFLSKVPYYLRNSRSEWWPRRR